MKEQQPLSRYGIGPYYASSLFVLTVGALCLHQFGILPTFSVRLAWIPCRLLAAFCVLAGAVLWVDAVIIRRIAQHIQNNELVTDGAYAWVRNPIYAAIMLVMWGLLLWSGNLLLLLLCPVYHLLMTIMVKRTEEKWLTARYGAAYQDYCKRVNRCIPWFPHTKEGV